jgi:hypothetical protein
MTGINGETLRAWRRSRRWDVPEMARRLRRAAGGDSVPVHDALVRMVRRWEREGLRTERYQLLYCAALSIVSGNLANGPREGRDAIASAPMPQSPVTPQPPSARWASGIYGAVVHPVEAARRAARLLPDVPVPATLQQQVTVAVAAELAADYARLAAALPDLVGAVELAALHVLDRHRTAVCALLADAYAVTAWSLIKADSAGAAWIAAQRAIQAAENAGDVLRASAATRCLAEVHMRAGEHSDATRTAFLAFTYVHNRPSAPPALVVRGSALLSAAAASARRGDAREAKTSLAAAEVCAEPLQTDRVDLGSVFGPVNTAIHRVAVAVELGDHQAATDAMPGVDLTRLPPQLAERRARYLIDVARAHAGLRDDQGAADALLQAEQVAPDELRGHRLTRAVLRDLLSRERRSSGVRDLADRCGVLAG